jgi:hypothetical protein
VIKMKVPELMAKAYQEAVERDASTFAGVEAVLRWQRDNPALPRVKQLEALWNSIPDTSGGEYPYFHKMRIVMGEWQRQMYVDTVPEEIEDLLLHDIKDGFFKPEILNEIIIQAFYRGQKAGLK